MVLLLSGCGGGSSGEKQEVSVAKHTPPAPTMAAEGIKPPESPRIDEE
jgi:hypothetical protein